MVQLRLTYRPFYKNVTPWGHLQHMMYEQTDSQDLNYKREDKWVSHCNYYIITIYYKSLPMRCLWSRLVRQYRSFSKISFSGSRSETIVQCFVFHSSSVCRFDLLHSRKCTYSHSRIYFQISSAFRLRNL